MPDSTHASSRVQRPFSINKPFFVSPPGAGRKITAGFSFLQRIGKSASIDVWFPEMLRQELDALIASGKKLGPQNFPAEWAAVRQFELLQESGNYKIYDMDASILNRSLVDAARNMRAGGYRVTVATIGSYTGEEGDDLEILDRRLQDRISRLTHMLYLEEQSEGLNAEIDKKLAEQRWDYQSALPHIGMTLGARELYGKQNDSSAKARHFFDILSLLPQNHIVHDMAVGLQLPESVAEQEWIYLAGGDMKLGVFNTLLNDLFQPFDDMSLGVLHGREGAGREIKSSTQHMRGYGDHMNFSTAGFYRDAAASLAL